MHTLGQTGLLRPGGEGRTMKMVVITAPKALAGFLKKIFHMEHTS